MTRPVRMLELVNFLARRSKSIREIAERFEISERTAFRDIADLSARVPLTRTEHGYRLVETATLRPLSLTAAERAVLTLVLGNPALRKTSDIGSTLRCVRGQAGCRHAATRRRRRARWRWPAPSGRAAFPRGS